MIRLETTLRINAPIERCFDLARSVEVHLAGNRHLGEEAVALGGVTTGLLGLGDRVTWRARHFGVRQHLTSEITAFDRPRYFQDRMLRGAFAFMEHDHYFAEVPGGATEMQPPERPAHSQRRSPRKRHPRRPQPQAQPTSRSRPRSPKSHHQPFVRAAHVDDLLDLA